MLDERFVDMSANQLRYIVHILCEHMHLQYRYGLVREVGSEIRERLLSALLSITCDPFSGRLGIPDSCLLVCLFFFKCPCQLSWITISSHQKLLIFLLVLTSKSKELVEVVSVEVGNI